jgi:hypothetical protein
VAKEDLLDKFSHLQTYPQQAEVIQIIKEEAHKSASIDQIQSIISLIRSQDM